jgi:pimeloyl-ACP methyl ester carboxylesterase
LLAAQLARLETGRVEIPKTRYARSGDVSIAYQVVGEGPPDLVYVDGYVSNVELGWQNPFRADWYERLASFSRLIIFDKRGVGVSDRVSEHGLPTLEERMDDVHAVMDDVALARAAVLGVSDGAAMSILFAATYPERTASLVLYGAAARFLWAPDYPWAPTRDENERQIDRFRRAWGTEDAVEEELSSFAPSLSLDEEQKRDFASARRLSASPGSAAALARMNMDIDVRHILPTLTVPTLILHRSQDKQHSVQGARWMAQQIPGAQYVELPGSDHVPFAGNSDALLREVKEFVTETWAETRESDRVLSTVLFTDIVDSTAKAVELGDRAWRQLLHQHHTRVRRELARFRGNEIDTVGDGFFASFDGPARAIRCACAILEAVDELGLELRAGLHTGECEVVDGKIGGIAVHIGARVAAEAEPGEVLVSGTVKDLVAGSGITFTERTEAALKGVPGKWPLFAVETS